MSRIAITHPHALVQEDARARVEAVASELRARYALATDWQGDVLVFRRSGVHGSLRLEPGRVRLDAELSFPVSLMQATIEQEIDRQIRRHFGARD